MNLSFSRQKSPIVLSAILVGTSKISSPLETCSNDLIQLLIHLANLSGILQLQAGPQTTYPQAMDAV